MKHIGYIDIHCHKASGNLDVKEIVQDIHSLGIHPWMAGDVDSEVMNNIINIIKSNENKQIVAIGECGIDKLCTTPLQVQKDIFKKQIELSEKYKLPVIIHCVKAMDEVLLVKKQMNATLPWIWHGFRGKPQQLEQILRAGFYVSFGYRYNKDSLHACPLNRLFLETDMGDKTIEVVYEQVSKELCISKEELATSISTNCQSVFGHF